MTTATLRLPQPTAAKSRRKPKPRTTPHLTPCRYKRGLTIALGVFIPVMSVATSKIAGTLATNGHHGLAAFGAGIGAAVLAVSLSHLAAGVSPRRNPALRSI